MKEEIETKEKIVSTNEWFYIENVFVILLFCCGLQCCLEAVIDWNQATQFGLMDLLLLNVKWAASILLCTVIGSFWKQRGVSFANICNTCGKVLLLFIVNQIILYLPTYFLLHEEEKISFIKPLSHNEFFVTFLWGSFLLVFFLFLDRKIKKKWFIIVYATLCVALSCIPYFTYIKAIQTAFLGMPIILLAYHQPEFLHKSKRYQAIGILLLLEGILFVTRNTAIPFFEQNASFVSILLKTIIYVMLHFLVSKIISRNEIPYFSKVGVNFPLIYASLSIVVLFLIQYFKGYFNTIVYRFGAIGIVLTGILISMILINPLFTKAFAAIKVITSKWYSSLICPKEWEKSIGKKLVMTKSETCQVSITISFLFVFTFLLFGPYELFIASVSYIEFNFSDFWWPMLLIALGVFAVLLIIATILKGKKREYYFCSLLGISFAGYLQGNFMNMDLGSLNGEIIDWSAYYPIAFFNSIVWIMIIGSVFVLYYLNKNAWKFTAKWISALLIAMQFVGLLSLLIAGNFNHQSVEYLSTDRQFELGSEENIIIFTLDMFDFEYMNHILEENPDFLEPLEGFTYYKNTTAPYVRTFPSVPYLMTGVEYTFDRPVEKYFEEAYKGSTHIKQLKEKGYDVQLFANMKYVCGSGKNISDVVSNISTKKRTPCYLKLCKMMMKLLCYRDMPQIFKPYFWLYTEDINAAQEDGYLIEDLKFYQDMMKTKVHIGDEKKEFIYYHLNGAHEPYILNDDITRNAKGSDVLSQTKGVMNIVFEYLDQMKKLGIYDQSTIIITADHGDCMTKSIDENPVGPILLIKHSGDSREQLKISNIPAINSDFWIDILGDEFVSTNMIERNLNELQEESSRTREVYAAFGGQMKVYEIPTNVYQREEWKVMDEYPYEYDLYCK